jgi:hypothetical protein
MRPFHWLIDEPLPEMLNTPLGGAHLFAWMRFMVSNRQVVMGDDAPHFLSNAVETLRIIKLFLGDDNSAFSWPSLDPNACVDKDGKPIPAKAVNFRVHLHMAACKIPGYEHGLPSTYIAVNMENGFDGIRSQVPRLFSIPLGLLLSAVQERDIELFQEAAGWVARAAQVSIVPPPDPKRKLLPLPAGQPNLHAIAAAMQAEADPACWGSPAEIDREWGALAAKAWKFGIMVNSVYHAAMLKLRDLEKWAADDPGQAAHAMARTTGFGRKDAPDGDHDFIGAYMALQGFLSGVASSPLSKMLNDRACIPEAAACAQ